MRKLLWVLLAMLAGVVLVASLVAQYGAQPVVVVDPEPSSITTPASTPSVAAGPQALPSATPESEFGTCQVTELYVPSLRPSPGEFNHWKVRPSKPEWDGDTPLPPRDSNPGDPDPEGAWTDAFTLVWNDAGPSASDQTVIISHSSGWRSLPFNSLMVKGAEGQAASRLKPGDLVYLRTACSGDYWLEYSVRADGVFTSGKPGFQTDPRIVGEAPQPGDLVLLTCLQPEVGKSNEVVAVRSHYTGNIVKL